MKVPRYSFHAIPDGVAGVRATLKMMGGIVRQFKTSPLIRECAVKIASKAPAKNWKAEAACIQQWVQNNIRYVKDVRGVETLQWPVHTLRLKAGDCDDQSILTASLLESIGYPTRFVAVGFMPNHFSHVLTQVKIGDKWLAVETTRRYGLGQMPRGIENRLVHTN